MGRERSLCNVITICLVILFPGNVMAFNLALSATISSSASGPCESPLTDFGVGVLNDGKYELTSGEYHCLQSGPTEWVELAWSSAQNIDRVWVDIHSSLYQFRAVEMQYWDGSSYITHGTVSPLPTDDWCYYYGGISTTPDTVLQYTCLLCICIVIRDRGVWSPHRFLPGGIGFLFACICM